MNLALSRPRVQRPTQLPGSWCDQERGPSFVDTLASSISHWQLRENRDAVHNGFFNKIQDIVCNSKLLVVSSIGSA